MEDFINNDGMFYGIERSIGGSSNMGVPFNKKPAIEKGDIRGISDYNTLHNVFTHTPKKMAQIKLTWALMHLLGIPCCLLSIIPPKWLLDINIGTIDQPYRIILYILSIAYLITIIGRSFEKWHHSHLVNKEERRRMREEFNKHHAHGTAQH